MSTLTGILSVAVRALQAEQAALSTVANNIANVETDGYTRQIAILSEESPLEVDGVLIGNGVSFDGVESVRDTVLEIQIDEETQQEYFYESYATAMSQVESLFSDTSGSGLGTAIDDFFSSWTTLTSDASDTSARQAVISAGEELAAVFNSIADQLDSIQEGLDSDVVTTVDEINSLTAQLASLNEQIMSLQSSNGDAGTLEDQRYELLNQLSELVDISITDSNDGALTVTTNSGALLVAGAENYELTTEMNSSTGFHDVYSSQGTDVTSDFTGGELAGLLKARDETIPSVESSIDDLAAGIINAVNEQSVAGYDLDGNAGTNFFVAVSSSSGSNAGAAANMTVAISDPSDVVASSDGSEGDNTVAQAIADLQDEAIVDGETASDYYANLVSNVGTEVSSAEDMEESVSLVLEQLEDQRSDISGVSVDEEAANLIVYQSAYEAAAKVVAIINELMGEVLNTI